jgi:hypothetical protein
LGQDTQLRHNIARNGVAASQSPLAPNAHRNVL